MNDTIEHTAGRIAERGREALVARLRPAYKEAASARAEELELSDEQIEQMVQRAADRADGLQWRRALASVATEELGIGLGEALGHPAVARAQAIVGAPSYEESLAGLGTTLVAPAGDDGGGVQQAQLFEPEAAAAEREAGELEPEAAEREGTAEQEREGTAEQEPEAAEREGTAGPEARTAEAGDERAMLRVAAVHLGGIANLAAEEGGLELQISDGGMEIARGESEIVGSFTWREIHGLEVAAPRGVRPRRRRDAQLVVRTGQGEVSFQIPALTPEQLREQLAPALERHQPRLLLGH